MANYDILVTNAAKFQGLSAKQQKICEAVVKTCVIAFTTPTGLADADVRLRVTRAVQNLPFAAGVSRQAVRTAIWSKYADSQVSGVASATPAQMLAAGRVLQGMSEEQIDDINLWLIGETLGQLS